MNLKKHFAADSPREVVGIKMWITDTMWIRVARHGNPKYQAKMKTLRRKYKHQIQMGSMSEKFQERMLKECLAGTVLTDWGGVLNDDATNCPFSDEAALDALNEDNLYQQILLISQDKATFDTDQDEIWLNDVLREHEEDGSLLPEEDPETKNSVTSSDGTWTTDSTLTSSE